MHTTNLAHVIVPELTYSQADLLVDHLEQLGVDCIFGVPGGAIEPLYDAIARNIQMGGNLSQIVARHEAGAAYMADGYARETGRIGVCIATSGPGATNMLTAVATAYENSIPLLVITGQPARPSFGRHALQESSCTGIDVLGMFAHCTRYNSLVSHPAQFEMKLMAALQAAHMMRGPVHLSLPVDVFRSARVVRSPSYDLTVLLRRAPLLDQSGISELRSLVSQRKRLVLLIGADCREAIGDILRFATLTSSLIVSTPDAKGLIDPYFPLYRGVFGFGGHATANAALRDKAVDLIIAVGASMGEWNTGGWSDSLLNERLVHIDASTEHLARTPMAALHVRGCPGAVFRSLLDAKNFDRAADSLYRTASADRRDRERDWNPTDMLEAPERFHSDAVPIKPQRLMNELGNLFPANSRFLADAGNSVAWATHYLQPRSSHVRDVSKLPAGGWLRLTSHFAPMGWAIGAAIGTAAGNPNVPVVYDWRR